MALRFILDSGAFSVWSAGATIDIDDYIRFCLRYPQVSYYVSLDVLLGKKGEVNRDPAMVEEACNRSWKNYQKMICQLPEEKVIPVFHKGESFKWLERYLDFGCTYIGLGQSSNGDSFDRSNSFKDLKQILVGEDGKPIVKLHGFAVTSLKNMKIMPWHSVDSASWIRAGSYGSVYIPKVGADRSFLYDKQPLVLNFSPRSPRLKDKKSHWENLTPTSKGLLKDYLRGLRVSLGKSEMVEVEVDYQLDRGNEIWLEGKEERKRIKESIGSGVLVGDAPRGFSLRGDVETKKTYSVLKILRRGVSNCHQTRFRVNQIFFEEVEKALRLDHIYLAGAEGSLDDSIEGSIKKRLMSYHTVQKGGRAEKAFRRHVEEAG